MSETGGLSRGWVLTLSGLLEGLSASPVRSPDRTQGWAFRVCVGQLQKVEVKKSLQTILPALFWSPARPQLSPGTVGH